MLKEVFLLLLLTVSVVLQYGKESVIIAGLKPGRKNLILKLDDARSSRYFMLDPMGMEFSVIKIQSRHDKKTSKQTYALFLPGNITKGVILKIQHNFTFILNCDLILTEFMPAEFSYAHTSMTVFGDFKIQTSLNSALNDMNCQNIDYIQCRISYDEHICSKMQLTANRTVVNEYNISTLFSLFNDLAQNVSIMGEQINQIKKTSRKLSLRDLKNKTDFTTEQALGESRMKMDVEATKCETCNCYKNLVKMQGDIDSKLLQIISALSTIEESQHILAEQFEQSKKIKSAIERLEAQSHCSHNPPQATPNLNFSVFDLKYCQAIQNAIISGGKSRNSTNLLKIMHEQSESKPIHEPVHYQRPNDDRPLFTEFHRSTYMSARRWPLKHPRIYECSNDPAAFFESLKLVREHKVANAWYIKSLPFEDSVVVSQGSSELLAIMDDGEIVGFRVLATTAGNLAHDRRGVLYMSDYKKGWIAVLDSELRVVNYLPNRFHRPFGISFYLGLIYVAQYEIGVISVIAQTGEFIRNITVPDKYITDLFISENIIYVSGNEGIHRFSLEGHSFGSPWKSNLVRPQQLFVDDNERLWVIDESTGHLFVIETSDGTIIDTFDVSDSAEKPTGFAFDSRCTLYVADNGKGSVFVYKPTRFDQNQL